MLSKSTFWIILFYVYISLTLVSKILTKIDSAYYNNYTILKSKF